MALIENDFLKTLKLPPMGQQGIVVKSIDDSLGFYSRVLNIKPWYRAKIVESEIYYKDKPIEIEMDIALGYSGALQFELIEVGKGDENVYTDLMVTRGEGLHHIGFVVSNINKGIDTLEKSGIQRIQHGVLKTKGLAITQFAYFDTIEHCGYITELIETKLFGISVGQSRFMMKLGRLFGDTDIITGF